MPDFVQHLRQQLAFIATSTREVMAGNLAEAVRIATAVRVIVHSTSRSTSLLEHLGRADPSMLSTGDPITPDALIASGALVMFIADLKGGARIEARLDRGPGPKVIPFSTWWLEAIELHNGMRLSRRDIILAASNKDGGAHVDDMLPEAYESVKRGVWTGSYGGSMPQRLDNQIASDIAQIGFEVQNSPGIKELITWPLPT